MAMRLSRDDIQRLDNITALKLLMYVNEYMEKETIKILRDKSVPKEVKSGDYDYAFNVWLSMDYVDEKGKSLIEYMLQDKRRELTPDEVAILAIKKESYTSIYQVVSQDFTNTLVVDLLLNKKLTIESFEIPHMVSEGDVFIARFANFHDYVINIGEVEMLYTAYVENILEAIQNQYRFMVKNLENYTMENYLKRHSYSMYCIVQDVLHYRKQDVLMERIERELKRFDTYLKQSDTISEQRRIQYQKNLREFHEKELKEVYRTLEDIHAEAVYKFMIGMSSCYAYSLEQIRSQLQTFEHFAEYLYHDGKIGMNEYAKILKICKEKDQFYEFNHYYQIYIGKYAKNIFNDMELKAKIPSNSLTYFELVEVQKIKEPFELDRQFQKYMENVSKMKLQHNLQPLNLSDEKYELIFFEFAKHFKLIEVNEHQRVLLTNFYSKYKHSLPRERFVLWVEFLWNYLNWNQLVQGGIKMELEYKNRQRYLYSLVQLESEVDYDFDKWRLGIGREDFSILNTGFKIYKSKIFIPYMVYYFQDLGLLTLEIKENASMMEKLHGLDILRFSITALGKEVMYYLLIRNKMEEAESKVIPFKRHKA